MRIQGVDLEWSTVREGLNVGACETFSSCTNHECNAGATCVEDPSQPRGYRCQCQQGASGASLNVAYTFSSREMKTKEKVFFCDRGKILSLSNFMFTFYDRRKKNPHKHARAFVISSPQNLHSICKPNFGSLGLIYDLAGELHCFEKKKSTTADATRPLSSISV